MAKEYVPIFFDWLDVTQDLTAEEKGNLIDAVVSYASGQEYEHFLTGGCKIAFRFLKGQVDRNTAISEARAKAGSSKREQNETNENKHEQPVAKLPKDIEKENKKDSTKRFAPPTVEDVAAYCKERNNGIDPEYFVAYYANRNWELSNRKKMVNWKLAIATWEKNNFNRSAPWNVQKKTVSAQQYEQRDYSDEQNEAMQRMLKSMQEGA